MATEPAATCTVLPSRLVSQATAGTPGSQPPSNRIGAQRRHDAFVEIFRRIANAPDGTRRRANLTVNLIVDEPTSTETLVAHGLAPAVPAELCDIDHIHEQAKGGATDTINHQLLPFDLSKPPVADTGADPP